MVLCLKEKYDLLCVRRYKRNSCKLIFFQIKDVYLNVLYSMKEKNPN